MNAKANRNRKKIFAIPVVTNVAGAAEVVSASCIVSSSVCFARDLANKPGNMLTPLDMAKEAQTVAEKCGMECEIT